MTDLAATRDNSLIQSSYDDFAIISWVGIVLLTAFLVLCALLPFDAATTYTPSIFGA